MALQLNEDQAEYKSAKDNLIEALQHNLADKEKLIALLEQQLTKEQKKITNSH